MMGRKSEELSDSVKEQIVRASYQVTNVSEVARIFDIPRTTVSSVLKKFRATGSVETRHRSARKTLFGAQRRILLLAKSVSALIWFSVFPGLYQQSAMP